MVFKAKRKGSDWERMAVKILSQLVLRSSWRKIPGSGAIGTSMDEPILTGDLSGVVESIPKKFKVECKTGYGNAKQFTLKKEWLDKIKQEADNYYSIPMLVGKFSDARDGVKHFVVLDVETFAYLLNMITELNEALKDNA